jgi:glucosamine-6-phosphate deaminase
VNLPPVPPISAPLNPASALQQHPKVTVLLDEEAAAELKLNHYYTYVYCHKSEWQRVLA